MVYKLVVGDTPSVKPRKSAGLAGVDGVRCSCGVVCGGDARSTSSGRPSSSTYASGIANAAFGLVLCESIASSIALTMCSAVGRTTHWAGAGGLRASL